MVQTVEWADPAEDPRALGALDGFLSDTLANNSVIQDLLDQQEDLGSALPQGCSTLTPWMGGHPYGVGTN